jgi:hypothetical protein
MRRASTWIVLSALSFVAVGWAQSPDEEPSPAMSDQAYQAPGAHVGVGRMPSPADLQAALSLARSRMQSVPSDNAGPVFENERVTVYIGRLPTLDDLKSARKRVAAARGGAPTSNR